MKGDARDFGLRDRKNGPLGAGEDQNFSLGAVKFEMTPRNPCEDVRKSVR